MLILKIVSIGSPSEQKHVRGLLASSVSVVTAFQLVCVFVVCESAMLVFEILCRILSEHIQAFTL